MATLLLQGAGTVLGGLVGGEFGASAGGLLGSLAGSLLSRSSKHGKDTEGPRLTTLAGLSSTDGAPVPRLYGRTRVGGQIIWATRFEESVSVERSGASGGKGGSGSKATTYTYSANIAVGLC